MSVSGKARQAVNACETAEVFLIIAKIETKNSSPLLLVNNTQAVTSNGEVYNPCGFTVTLPPEAGGGGSQPAQVAIDNVDRAIMELVQKGIGKKIYITLSVILAGTPDVIERGPMKFILRNVTADKSTVKGDLYDFYVTDRIIPSLKYTQNVFPGLY